MAQKQDNKGPSRIKYIFSYEETSYNCLPPPPLLTGLENVDFTRMQTSIITTIMRRTNIYLTPLPHKRKCLDGSIGHFFSGQPLMSNKFVLVNVPVNHYHTRNANLSIIFFQHQFHSESALVVVWFILPPSPPTPEYYILTGLCSRK